MLLKFSLQVLIKEERKVDPDDMYAENLPMKDYGKRKPNDTVENTKQQPAAKKMKTESATTEPTSNNSTSSSEASTKISPKQAETKNQKKKKKKKNNFQQSNATNSSNNPQQFDYGQVDFKKFKGGSHQAKRNDNEVQTKFHGKVMVFL